MIFNASSCWRADIRKAPVSPDSERLIRYMGALSSETGGPAGVRAEWGPTHGRGRSYICDGSTRFVQVTMEWNNLALPGPYPIPESAKADFTATSGDRLMFLFRANTLYELFGVTWTGTEWTAIAGCAFNTALSDDVNVDGTPRVGGATASDSGLSTYAGMVTWEDLNLPAGLQHAVAGATWQHKGFVPPARYGTMPNGSPEELRAVPEGTRLRLKAGFPISTFQPTTQRLLAGLKKFGVILIDGSAWYDLGLAGTWDARWPADRGYHFDQSALAGVPLTAFDVVTL